RPNTVTVALECDGRVEDVDVPPQVRIEAADAGGAYGRHALLPHHEVVEAAPRDHAAGPEIAGLSGPVEAVRAAVQREPVERQRDERVFRSARVAAEIAASGDGRELALRHEDHLIAAGADETLDAPLAAYLERP